MRRVLLRWDQPGECGATPVEAAVVRLPQAVQHTSSHSHEGVAAERAGKLFFCPSFSCKLLEKVYYGTKSTSKFKKDFFSCL